METILLQINDDKAYRLIEDLESLNIIKILKRTKTKGLSQKFAGSLNLSAAEYQNFQNQITQNRTEWERDI